MRILSQILLIGTLCCSSLVLASPQQSGQKNGGTKNKPLELASVAALVVDVSNGRTLLEKNADVPMPIASITKLMTSLIVVESNLDLDQILVVDQHDRDNLKNTYSRVRFGTQVSRRDALNLALMSSENRMASALGRHYPGGIKAFVAAMNRKASQLGMHDTRFFDSSGLNSRNVSTARDLATLISAAARHPLIRNYSTSEQRAMRFHKPGYSLQFNTTNPLVKNDSWHVKLQKTGFTNEAGRCLVMLAKPGKRELAIVLLDSNGKRSPIGDAGRIRTWLEGGKPAPVPQHARAYAQARQKQIARLTAAR